jgi:signal transduction histidine kinase
LAFIEHSELGEWVRGSDCVCAFPTIVTLHNIGMVFLAGGSVAIDLRIIGFAPQMPLQSMGRFVPVLWLAFAVIAVTGTLLLIAYPTKALTNPLFYIKLCLVALAVGLVYRIATDILRPFEVDQKPLPAKAKVLAIASLAAWVALIAAGRYLAYTHKWEMLGVPAVL